MLLSDQPRAWPNGSSDDNCLCSQITLVYRPAADFIIFAWGPGFNGRLFPEEGAPRI